MSRPCAPDSAVLTSTQARLVAWQSCDGGWAGRGPSGVTWTIELHHQAWILGSDACAALAQAADARPLIDAATACEAMWLATHEGALHALSLEFLLKARAFAIAQREDLIRHMRDAGFDPSGMAGPCEDWMKREIVETQRAIDAFEREAVERGWQPTLGS